MSWLLAPTPNLIPCPGCSACFDLNKVSPKQAFGTVLVFWGLWFICLLGYGPSNAAMSTSAAHRQLLSWQLRTDTSYSHDYRPGGLIDLHLAEIEARLLVRSWCHYWLQIIGATVSLRLRHALSNPQDCAIHLSHVLYANPELISFQTPCFVHSSVASSLERWVVRLSNPLFCALSLHLVHFRTCQVVVFRPPILCNFQDFIPLDLCN